MLNMSCSVGNDYCIAHANALCRTEPWNTFQNVNEIGVGKWRSELPSSSILWKILLPASWIWTSSRATVVSPKVLWWFNPASTNHDSLLFREAPFSLSPPLFGHCLNSNYTPPRTQTGTLGHFFQALFSHFKGLYAFGNGNTLKPHFHVWKLKFPRLKVKIVHVHL